MSELGAMSQNILNIQQMQMSLIKNQVQMQQKAIEVLLEDSAVPVASNIGQNVDTYL